MSRHSSSGSVDRYYAGSRLRFPRSASRDTDRKAERWGCLMPVEPTK